MLLYKAVLVSAAQRSDSVIHIFLMTLSIVKKEKMNFPLMLFNFQT